MKLPVSSPCRKRSANHSASPGKEAALPRPPPLGTGQDGYPSSGSSLSVAPDGTRFHHGQSLAVYLPMAVGMQQHLVGGSVAAAVYPPHHVMEMPAGLWRDGLAADRAAPCLLVPQGAVPPFPCQGLLHRHAEAFLEVVLPGRVVRVGLRPHLDVADDGHAERGEEPDGAGYPGPAGHLAGEDPATAALRAEVVRPHPAGG